MKNVVVISCLIMTLPFADVVGAQEIDVDSSSDKVWSVGAGVGFGYYSPGGLSGLFSLSCLSSKSICSPNSFSYFPNVNFAVERKLNQSLFLMMKLSGAYHESDAKDQFGLDETLEGKEIGAVLGLRWVLNPAGVVKISPTFTFGGQWGWYSSETKRNPEQSIEARHFDADGYSVGLLVGIVLERELIKDLFLRLESSLLHLTYSRTELLEKIENETAPEVSSNSVSAGLAFNPSLQLRLQF